MTANKFKILGSDYHAELEKIIDEDNLPGYTRDLKRNMLNIISTTCSLFHLYVIFNQSILEGKQNGNMVGLARGMVYPKTNQVCMALRQML